jgi:hypothetical protein
LLETIVINHDVVDGWSGPYWVLREDGFELLWLLWWIQTLDLNRLDVLDQ